MTRAPKYGGPTAPNPTEAQVETRVIAIYRAAGCQVYKLSQGYRAERGGTRQTPGLPDLYVVPPRGPVFWHETKRPKGAVVRPAQQAFADLHAADPVRPVVVRGGAEAAYTHLHTIGLLTARPLD